MLSVDKDEKQSAKAPPPDAGRPLNGARTEPDSGLIDLRSLAEGELANSQTGMKQAKEEREAAILALTSSASLSQIVLPLPGKELKEVVGAPKSRTGLVIAAVLLLAGAAGLVFWLVKRNEKQDKQVAANEPGSSIGAPGGGAPGGAPEGPGGAGGGSLAGGAVADHKDDSTSVKPDKVDAVDDKAAKEDRPADDKADKSADKDAKADKAEKGAKADKGVKADKADKAVAKADKADKAVAKADKADKAVAKADKAVAKADEGRPANADGSGGKTKPTNETQRDIQKLLDEAGGPDRKEAPVDDKPKKTRLETAEIKAGMAKVKGTARACGSANSTSGVVQVKVTIAPSGSVSTVTILGEFAGKPAGACVKEAVQGASFPKWEGTPMTVNFSFPID